jgi:hypothetical protein
MEFDPKIEEDDGLMSPEQQRRVGRLTPDEIEAIDKSLFDEATHQFKKISRIVGSVMLSEAHPSGINCIFFADRVRNLVATGKLEYQGHLPAMHLCEVRLVSRSDGEEEIFDG